MHQEDSSLAHGWEVFWRLSGIRSVLGSPALLCEVREVDADPVALRRYGHKVPVVEVDGLVACHGHLDAAEVGRLLRPR